MVRGQSKFLVLYDIMLFQCRLHIQLKRTSHCRHWPIGNGHNNSKTYNSTHLSKSVSKNKYFTFHIHRIHYSCVKLENTVQHCVTNLYNLMGTYQIQFKITEWCYFQRTLSNRKAVVLNITQSFHLTLTFMSRPSSQVKHRDQRGNNKW